MQTGIKEDRDRAFDLLRPHGHMITTQPISAAEKPTWMDILGAGGTSQENTTRVKKQKSNNVHDSFDCVGQDYVGIVAKRSLYRIQNRYFENKR